MSGSPIIIEGRNAGALSFGIGDDLGPYLFVATPIEKMLDVEAQELDAVLTDGASAAGDPLAAVLTIPSGAAAWFDGAAWADERFLILDDDIVGAAAEGGESVPLEPGSAIAVLVTTGDVLNMGGIGTVTSVDGDAVWAFGHPMTGVGDIAFPFSAASFVAIASSAAWGYSSTVGAPTGPLLGTITNDRSAAIAGRHGIAAPMVAVDTHGTYEGTAEHVHHATARLADNAWFNADQALFAAVWPLTVQRDAPFGGAGSIAYEVQVYVAETGMYATRRDIVSNAWWPEEALFSTLVNATAKLTGKDRLPLTLTAVTLTADVSDDRRELTVGNLTHADEIAPGDELVIAVELLPFGSTESEQRALVFTVPEDFPPGPAMLAVGSEIHIGTDAPRLDDWRDPACEDPTATEDAEDLIARFNMMPRHHVLVGLLQSRTLPDDCPPCEDPVASCEPCEPP
ncbi:MAG: hypothetical protein Q7S02_04085, partial [bacterium]|nr:hypothetical protein [bacterium]